MTIRRSQSELTQSQPGEEQVTCSRGCGDRRQGPELGDKPGVFKTSKKMTDLGPAGEPATGGLFSFNCIFEYIMLQILVNLKHVEG